MKIARYWKRAQMHAEMPNGKPVNLTAWGWSATSAEEAEQSASNAVQRSAQRVAAGQGFPDSYGYSDRPSREEIIEEIDGAAGETVAMITRNSYGALVLNTARLMFIDIDVPFEASGARFIRTIKSIFGIAAPDPFERSLQEIFEKARSMPEYTFRVYRTAAGFRCAVINKRIDPVGSESENVLHKFGSDKLYIRLCKNQESFRARLTPKHWRCGVDRPHGRFPFGSESVERRYREWETKYDAACAAYATCSFVEQFGTQEGVAEFRKLIELHDRETKANLGLPLA